MMYLKNRLLLFFTVTILAACASSTQPTTFYLLKSLPPSQLEKKQPEHKAISILIKPVKFPEYLNRPQMVVREGEYQLKFSEFNRWGEPLKGNFSQVLIENLNARIAPGQALVFSELDGIKPDYQLSIEVLRMDINKEHQAVFRVKWVLIVRNHVQSITRYLDEYSIPVINDKNYESAVEAQSKAVALFADKVAETVRSIRLKTPKIFEYK